MTATLRIATYNLHKGLSMFNRRVVIHEAREHLRALDADIVFLQEVQGNHARHARRHPDWPAAPQHEFLADSVWNDFAYGRNAVYQEGHHGNAILSRYPIMRWENINISAHEVEQRGLLHCEIAVPGHEQPLHCVCVHLGLLARFRGYQMRAVRARIERHVPADAAFVMAGDFNDWRQHARGALAQPLGLREVFEHSGGRCARSFPSLLPVLPLDRIYVRGLDVRKATVHSGRPWALLSDHAALTATLAYRGARL